MVANATAEPVRAADRARELLAEQLTAPVRWVACMAAAARLAPDARFIETGPGTVLAGLLKRIVPGATVLSLGTADEVERIAEAIPVGAAAGDRYPAAQLKAVHL